MKKVVIDPGHGGWDPGATALDGIQERYFTWELSKALGDYLAASYVVEVIYTHEGADTALDPSGNQARELAARSWVANSINADLLVSIHHDNAGNPSARGASLWIWTSKNSPTGGLVWLPAAGNHTDPKTYPIARAMVGKVRETLASLGVPWRSFGDPDGIACANFGILRNTRGPAVLIECFHGSNAEDVAAARKPEFIPTLAKGIGDAIALALGLPRKESEKPVERKEVRIVDAGGNLLTVGWLENGKTIAEVRPLLEAMGLVVEWRQEGEKREVIVHWPGAKR